MRHSYKIIVFMLLMAASVSAQWRPIQPYNMRYWGLRADSFRSDGPVKIPDAQAVDEAVTKGQTLSITQDSIHNWSIQGPVVSYPVSKVDDSHTFNLGGDTLINIFRYDPAQYHVSNSDSVVKRYSYNGGVTWTARSLVYYTDSVDGNQATGICGNNIVIFLRRYDVNNLPGTANVGFIYSADKGLTWSSFTTVTPLLNDPEVKPFGKIVPDGTGKYVALMYLNGYCEAWESSNNGVTWSARGVVYDYRVSNPTRVLAEPYIAKLAQDSMLVHARDQDKGNQFYQLTSVNNGNAWTYQGRTNIGADSTTKVAPCVLYDASKDIVISVLTQRHVDNTVNNFQWNTKNDSIIVFINRPAEIFATPTNYRPLMTMKRPEPDLISMYGYADMVRLNNGDYLGIITERLYYNGGERSHLYQFDMKWLIDRRSDQSSRYGGLTPMHNSRTGFTDQINLANQGEVVDRLDSISIIRPNSTLLLTAPGTGGSIMTVRSKSGNLLHTFGATGRVLLNNPTDDFQSALQVTGRGRFTDRVAVGNAVNSNEAMTKGQVDALIATAVKNNANNQFVLTPFSVTGSGSGATSFSVMRFYESDNTTLIGQVGDASSGDSDMYVAATNGFRVSAGGTLRLRVTSTGLTAIGSHTPTSTLDLSGSLATAPPVATSGNLTLTAAHYAVRVTNTSHAITLPTASTCPGRLYVLVNYNTGGNVTISSVNRNGSAVTALPDNAKWTIQSDGSAWYVIQD